MQDLDLLEFENIAIFQSESSIIEQQKIGPGR